MRPQHETPGRTPPGWSARGRNRQGGGPSNGQLNGRDSQTAADIALLRRPSFSIRKRIALSFLLCFLVIGGVTLASLVTLGRIEQKLHFLEVADTYTNQIQQARRFEKNYLLYGTGLDSALEYAHEARATLGGASAEFARIVGQKPYGEMRQHLERYEQLLLGLAGVPTGAAGARRSTLEAEIRQHGAEMVAAALRVAEAERQSVRSMLRLSKQMPLAALAVLLVLIVYITNFLARQLLAPLGRMVNTAGRIAKGDFTPLQPTRRYRDEFTGLALAINRMMQELNHRQEALAEAQKLRAIGTLTAGIAHELNNPINNISLTAEAMLEDHQTLGDEDRLDLCRDLLTQTERAQGIVRNLLDFSRQRDVHMEVIDLAGLLQSTVRLAGNQIKLAGARLELAVPDGVPAIRGDRQQLSQVFVNLYLNALDAMGSDGIIRVSVGSDPEQPGRVQIDVSDNGAGIPADVLPFVFDPFFTTKAAKGTGLGLSVSYGIVSKHGGDIRVTSTPGRGTTLSVFLPKAQALPDAESESGLGTSV
ncbi:MAG: HAMP domain-containing sensor histidine kinase [Acidobacteria bacterium]|nr:HAMP domain-containing sensor histidine kinase [Acidobacteriota bacterium]